MAERTYTLFESATRSARLLKQGPIMCIIIDGGGAMICFTDEFLAAQKWASRKPATGNAISDRGRFLDQLSVMITRPGSFMGTRGSDKIVEKLARAMMAAGYDLGEWSLPPELKSLGHPGPVDPKPKKAADEQPDGEAEAGEQAPAAESPPPDVPVKGR